MTEKTGRGGQACVPELLIQPPSLEKILSFLISPANAYLSQHNTEVTETPVLGVVR